MNKIFDAIGITDPTTQLLINGCLNIYNFIIAVIAGLLCDKIGRRPLFIASTIGMFVFWVLQTVCFGLYSETGNITAAHTFIAMICDPVLRFLYTVEILPFPLRAKGFTIFNLALSLSLIFNHLGWKYYIVYVCWLAFEIGFIWKFLVETKNRTLEETAALFDGEDTADHLAEHAAINAGISDSHSDREKGSTEEIKEEVVA
ncbi:hypothetical protein TRAPUB_2236 [Trametes pubescens]|uniref:Major facilitator superfamily (MFS) profile domain-containing protein n=1 Tax=Trametes pubescens TaxID=154538 RepID=A0A1M2VHA0_TRAPU|nr:hypothetical protein TRAPUB_2236 [Trametes pubescens]